MQADVDAILISHLSNSRLAFTAVMLIGACVVDNRFTGFELIYSSLPLDGAQQRNGRLLTVVSLSFRGDKRRKTTARRVEIV